jgi:ketosteroid isomerase-like protein
MTKTSFFSAILLCSAALLSQEQPAKAPAAVGAQSHCSIPADDQALRQIADDWKDGYNNGNAAKVAALYTEDAYYLTQHFATGILHGRASMQAYVQRGVDAGYHVDSIDVVMTECHGDFAYTVTRYESTNASQKAFGVNLLVLRKVGDKWRIVAHESAVPDPATAIQRLDIPSPH